mgnify:CR=1 FL=1
MPVATAAHERAQEEKNEDAMEDTTTAAAIVSSEDFSDAAYDVVIASEGGLDQAAIERMRKGQMEFTA